MKKSLVFLVAICATGFLSANAADVKETWSKNCVKCHGEDGAGKTKMGEKLKIKDLTDATLQASLKDADITKAVKEGVKDGDTIRMKSFADVLSDDEVKALIAQVRSFKK